MPRRIGEGGQFFRAAGQAQARVQRHRFEFHTRKHGVDDAADGGFRGLANIFQRLKRRFGARGNQAQREYQRKYLRNGCLWKGQTIDEHGL